MWNRKSFIKASATAATLLATGQFPIEAMVPKDEETILTILHTNDVHSRIEPFPMDGGKNQGLGGAAHRMTMIKSIRQENSNVLLLDAGDLWQGTPYFNFFNGEVEYKLMNEMGYDAATLGNHDFDIGLEGLKKQLPTARFSMLNANYDFEDTILKGMIQPYKVFDKNGIKVGVFGIGIELEGLVSASSYGNIKYNDPIKTANATAEKLKREEGCQFVICLSHLGFKYENNKVSDEVLSASTKNIDLILGGHTHTFFEKPLAYKNLEGKEVLLNQVGWAGLMLGRLDFHFKKMTEKKYSKFSNTFIGKS
jgi:5'-nucleotidase